MITYIMGEVGKAIAQGVCIEYVLPSLQLIKLEEAFTARLVKLARVLFALQVAYFTWAHKYEEYVNM